MLRGLIEIWRVIRGAVEPLEWVLRRYPPVDRCTSAGRAATCIACPHNGHGPLTQWFTIPAARRIRRHIAKYHRRDLSTPFDGSLGVCEACRCPLKLKVHENFSLLLKHLKPDVHEELWERCWIRREKAVADCTDVLDKLNKPKSNYE